LFSVALKTENPQSDRARGVTIPFRLLKIAAIVVIVAAVGVAVWYFAIRSTPKTSSPPVAVKTIHLTYPSDWRAVSAKTVRGVPSDAVIVLQTKNELGVLTVLPSGKAPALDTASVNKMNAALAKKYADYKFLSAKVLTLKQEKALLFNYLRTKQGVFHSITIIPVGNRSFWIETASPPTNGKLGTEIGKIIKSATISSKS
jgi:hypothetical protein